MNVASQKPPKKKKINPDDLVPIFGVVKSYSESKYRSDGTKKNANELESIEFKHHIKFLSRGDNYSHALVSFNDDLTDMYSYDDEGFVHDSIMDDNGWLATESIYICVMFITKPEFEDIKRFCHKLSKTETKYGYANVLSAYVGKPVKDHKRFICSTITAYLLMGSNPKNIHRDYSRIRPEDITILPRSFYVMNVKDRNDFLNRKSEFKKKVEQIKREHEDEIIDYNNDLPRLKLEDKMTKLKTWDKILEWIVETLV